MRSKLLTACAWLCCGAGAAMILADATAYATTYCDVYCYNHTGYCNGGGVSDECTEYLFSQGHYAHAPSSSGSTIQSQAPSKNGVREYTWGQGLCDTGGGYGLEPEICACGGNYTEYPPVTLQLCVYVSSSS